MKRLLFLVFIVLFSQFLFSQKINCDNAFSFLGKQEKAIAEINTLDPEFIPLHNLLLQDIKENLDAFDTVFIPILKDCPALNYYNTVSRYDQVVYLHRLKADTMSKIANKVDSLFYAQAQFQMLFENRGEALYQLNRSLQYNRTYPEALIMKCELMFDLDDYEQCLEILQVLYYDTDLTEEHENQLIHFTMRFYEKLYETADSLVKVDLASEALRLFKILEQFCVNMPSTYCNDDYYHGILRSKKGVYESYLLIATVAKERGSPEIAEKFRYYAEQYRMENESDITNSANAKKLPSESHLQIPEYELNNYNTYLQGQIEKLTIEIPIEERVVIVDQTIVNVVADTVQESTNLGKSVYSREEIEQMELEYNRLFGYAVTQCLNNNFSEAYKTLKNAVELEECGCFKIDPRIRVLYESISEMR